MTDDEFEDTPITVGILLWDLMALVAVFMVFGFVVGYLWI